MGRKSGLVISYQCMHVVCVAVKCIYCMCSILSSSALHVRLDVLTDGL